MQARGRGSRDYLPAERARIRQTEKPTRNTLTRFVRTTILGAVFFLIPIVILVIVLAKALEYANKALQVIVVHILAASELSATAATVLSVVIVALACFLAGLIARSMTAQRSVRGLENTVLSKVPAYEYLKQESARALGVATMTEQPVVWSRQTSAGRSAPRRKQRGEGSSPCSCRERPIRIRAGSISCRRIESAPPRSS